MRLKISFLCVLGMLLLFAANVNAQVTSGSFTVSPFFGLGHHTWDSSLQDDSTYGISIGYDVSENFGIEASYNVYDADIQLPDVLGPDPDGPGPAPAPVLEEGGASPTDGKMYRIEGLFYLYPGKKLAPFATLGIGRYEYSYPDNDIKNTNFPVGLGIKYFITDYIALRADVKAFYKMPENPMLATVGVTFQFGGK